MTASLIGFVFCIILFVLSLFWIFTSDWGDGGFIFGVLFIVSLFGGFACGLNIFGDKKRYEGKYNRKIENVTECRIDTTYTTINGVTDTTYTIYYINSEKGEK